MAITGGNVMKYEIGQKVETPLGVGVIKKVETWIDGHIQFVVYINDVFVTLSSKQLNLYRTPHEKLLDMGFEIYNGEHQINIINNSGNLIIINKKLKRIDSLGKYLTFDLWKIFAEYLEWLEEEK